MSFIRLTPQLAINGVYGVYGLSNPEKRSGRACLRLFAAANMLEGKIEDFAIIYWPG